MKLVSTNLRGLQRIVPAIHRDGRGEFIKIFHRTSFADLGLHFNIAEEFFSISGQGILRGMHFQLPPAAHNKMVFCVQGSVLDVVLDLRRDSPTYGETHAEVLDEKNRHALFIPSGFAHGFLTRAAPSIMYYLTDMEHVPACDAGIRWNSFGFQWEVTKPVLSQRDQDLPSLADFVSPFKCAS